MKPPRNNSSQVRTLKLPRQRSKRPLYFTDVLVRICHTYQVHHKGMMQLREKLVKAYQEQRPLTVREQVTSLQLALALEKRFQMGQTLDTILSTTTESLLNDARGIKA